ncbi:MAG: endonuclease MutS2 [Clostridia bacterium]|nr:endonuclease MutS2 [Clostridia bacterium]
MPSDIKNFKTLELDKVLSMLSNEITLPAAAERAAGILPCFDIKEVQRSLDKTYAAYQLLGISVMPSFSAAADNSEALKRASLGGVLNAGELLLVAKTLQVVRTLKVWRENVKYDEKTCIDGYFENLVPNKFLEEAILSCIKNDETISDNASPELSSIRRKISSAQNSIREKLDKTLRGEMSKYLQEGIITQRDGRFVVPVKSEYRGNFAGIVHDTSASGATLFIEPMSVVEINNDIRVLRSKEKEEIDRILAELSAKVAEYAEQIVNSYRIIVELAVVFGKASLAYKMRAVMPKMNEEGRVVLKNARHPLISPKTVVPISLTLGKEYNSLVITGPNTGGKTVTLKTIGLLTLMAMCGLMVPCDDDSELCVFDKILVDIGDEQSIEQSLSTFSSHMVNVISIIEKATPWSLVLIDELGSGTDPIEGAALATAILIKLYKKGARIAATTHYAELKSYALTTEGVENASCEFDIETLKPTYRLLIGVPGRSNAFAISEKLGLSADIISEAKGYVNNEDRQFESIIAALENERKSVENTLREVEALKLGLAEQKKTSDSKLAEAQRKYEQILDKAKTDASYIIDKARYKSDALINELEDIKKKINSENAADKFRVAKNLAKNQINEMLDDANPVSERLASDYKLPRELRTGDSVKIIDISRDGTVSEISGKRVLVLSGSMRLWVEMDNLMLLEKKKSAPSKGISKPSSMERIASTEIDIRGLASDEAVIELGRFIDNAVLTNINSVTIIHGKGTGVLRAAVHKYLRGHKAIKNFRVGLFGEGENGVTIAELNK